MDVVSSLPSLCRWAVVSHFQAITRGLLALVIIGLTLSLSACQSLGPAFQEPTVQLADVKLAEQRGLRQFFDVALTVSNPNAYALNLVGINYEVQLQGFDVIAGSINDVPSIPAYGESDLRLKFGIGLVQGLQMLNALSSSSSGLDYRVLLQLDTGIPLLGMVPISRSGRLDASSFGAASN